MDQVLSTGSSITLVHFTYEVGNEWRIACMPGMTEFHETQYHRNYQRSNDTRAVTCPACRRSAVFIEAQTRMESALGGRRGK